MSLPIKLVKISHICITNYGLSPDITSVSKSLQAFFSNKMSHRGTLMVSTDYLPSSTNLLPLRALWIKVKCADFFKVFLSCLVLLPFITTSLAFAKCYVLLFTQTESVKWQRLAILWYVFKIFLKKQIHCVLILCLPSHQQLMNNMNIFT